MDLLIIIILLLYAECSYSQNQIYNHGHYMPSGLGVSLKSSYPKTSSLLRGGVQAYIFLKQYFEIQVGGDGLDTYPPPEGGFGSMRVILPM